MLRWNKYANGIVNELWLQPLQPNGKFIMKWNKKEILWCVEFLFTYLKRGPSLEYDEKS